MIRQIFIFRFFLLACIILLNTVFLNAIEIKDKEIDFGNVKEKSIVIFETEIINNRAGILKTGARASCDCITVTPERVDIGPSQKQKIKIQLDTAGYNGKFNEQIFVQSNDSLNPYITVAVKANIINLNRVDLPEIKEVIEKKAADINRPVIYLTVFNTAGCHFCQELNRKLIPAWGQKYNAEIKVKEYDVNQAKNFELLVSLENKHKKTFNKIPTVFIGDDIIGGKKEIIAALPLLISKYAALGGAKEMEISGSYSVNKDDISKKLKLFPVMIAGLVDGINPCAFAAIIFLVSYMSLIMKKPGYEIFVTGIVFVSGVYITYLLIGIGILNIVQKLGSMILFSKIMYLTAAGVTFCLSGANFYDAAIIKKYGVLKSSYIKLKLPETIKLKIYGILKITTKFKYMVVFVFFAAILITLLEFFCTGQVYLPAIIYLVSIKEQNLTAIIYLLFYCFLFVLPLIVIFTLIYFGMTTESLKRFFAGKMFIAKMIMAAFFLLLGVFMLTQISY